MAANLEPRPCAAKGFENLVVAKVREMGDAAQFAMTRAIFKRPNGLIGTRSTRKKRGMIHNQRLPQEPTRNLARQLSVETQDSCRQNFALF